MKSVKISPIYLGRYRIEVVNDKDEYTCVDGGSAYVMMLLTDMIFKPEHRQYMADQRASSDQLAIEALERMKQGASPAALKLIEERQKKYDK